MSAKRKIVRLKPRQKVGSAELWYSHHSPTWHTDSCFYTFPALANPAKGIKIRASKHDDGRIEITADGPLGYRFEFFHPIPDVLDDRGLHVVITWEHNEVSFYIN